jgi:hypothetical protein
MNKQNLAFSATGLVSDQSHALEALTEIHPEGLCIRVSTPVVHCFHKVVVRQRGRVQSKGSGINY